MTSNTPDDDAAKASDESAADQSRLWFKSLRDGFWVPGSGLSQALFQAIDTAIEEGDFSQDSAFSTLRSNLDAIVDYLFMPYRIALSVSRESAAAGGVEWNEEIGMRQLSKVVEAPKTASQMTRVLHQAALLAWSAYETFSRDLFVEILNEHPELFDNLRKSGLKEKFPLQDIVTFDRLLAEGFDFTDKFGTLVADGRDFSSPSLLRQLFQKLLPRVKSTDALSKALQSRALWLLGCRRHLIAHRGGIVDEKYIATTGDKPQNVGKLLKITGAEIEECMHAISMACVLSLHCYVQYQKLHIDSAITMLVDGKVAGNSNGDSNTSHESP